MNNFNLKKLIEMLERTPNVVTAILANLSEDFASANEGGETWNVFDVIGHLIHGEKTDWIPRMNIILSNSADKTFPAFDRFAQFEESDGKTLSKLLSEFKDLRERNIKELLAKNLTQSDFEKKGIHPALGEVSLSELLATWMVHDLDHVSQISRILAKQYKSEVGPWVQYLKILNTN